jgi:hypothetical protein
VIVLWVFYLTILRVELREDVDLQLDEPGIVGSHGEEDGSFVNDWHNIIGLLVLILGNWSCCEKCLVFAAEKLVKREVILLALGGTVCRCLASCAFIRLVLATDSTFC